MGSALIPTESTASQQDGEGLRDLFIEECHRIVTAVTHQAFDMPQAFFFPEPFATGIHTIAALHAGSGTRGE